VKKLRPGSRPARAESTELALLTAHINQLTSTHKRIPAENNTNRFVFNDSSSALMRSKSCRRPSNPAVLKETFPVSTRLMAPSLSSSSFTDSKDVPRRSLTLGGSDKKSTSATGNGRSCMAPCSHRSSAAARLLVHEKGPDDGKAAWRRKTSSWYQMPENNARVRHWALT